jgi:hypothetical protein
MKEYKIKQDLLIEVLNYLVTKPYIEVYQMVAQLQATEILEEKKCQP